MLLRSSNSVQRGTAWVNCLANNARAWGEGVEGLPGYLPFPKKDLHNGHCWNNLPRELVAHICLKYGFLLYLWESANESVSAVLHSPQIHQIIVKIRSQVRVFRRLFLTNKLECHESKLHSCLMNP